MDFDVLIIGAGPGGIFSAYELTLRRPDLRVAVVEAGHELARRRCPIDGERIKSCVSCATCSIMSGFGGAGAFSDGKYNITNDFGGTLYEYLGKARALELMRYVDDINLSHGGEGTRLYSTAGTCFKKRCVQNDLHLLDAQVRHLGTDINFVVLQNLYNELKEKVSFFFDTPVETISAVDGGYWVTTGEQSFFCRQCVISAGRSGSKWIEQVCDSLAIPTHSNRVDIGVRVELPADVFSHLTDELYESKIVYRTKKYGDLVRTFCMNPKGSVVSENTNGIITVNGHSYEDPARQTQNTNFALLVSKHFSEPFKDSNGYGESIARLSNMLGGGIIVQRFGDLIQGRRSTPKRIAESFVTPTLQATPGDLSLVLPKRILDGIIEMVQALDKVAPGTANEDTLLYGVEVKFYNMEVEVNEHLETRLPGLYIIGDGSGITHSLSHASASGIHVARQIAEKDLSAAPTEPFDGESSAAEEEPATVEETAAVVEELVTEEEAAAEPEQPEDQLEPSPEEEETPAESEGAAAEPDEEPEEDPALRLREPGHTILNIEALEDEPTEEKYTEVELNDFWMSF